MTEASTRPGLIRSIAHRLAGDAAELPVEGRLAVVRRRDRLAQLGAADAGGAPGTGRPRRLLDLHLRELAADAPVRPGVGGQVPRRWADRDRRPHARVRLRARRRQHRRPVARLRRRVPDRDRQRLRRVARLRESLLAGGVHRRRAGSNPAPPLRRGRVRPDRDGHPAAAARRRGERRRPGAGRGRAARTRGRRRLADAPIARDVHRIWPEHGFASEDAARSTSPTSTPQPPGCHSTTGTSRGAGRSPGTPRS